MSCVPLIIKNSICYLNQKSRMLPKLLLLYLALVVQIHFATCLNWNFGLTRKNIKIKPDDWDTEENKRTYEDNCVCGQDESKDFKPWSLYIFALLKNTDRRRLKYMRRCVGTLINSNMVLTSHKCLAQQLNQTIKIYNAWINNFTLPFERIFVSRSILIENDVFPIKDIIINTRYAYNEVKGVFPGSDMAILVLKDPDMLQKMIPICLPEYKRDLNINYQIGYFYGLGGIIENDITEERRSATNVPILPESDCEKERRDDQYHLKAVTDSFCIRFPTLAPRSPGGPLIIGVGVSNNSKVNATAFLVGLSSKTYYRNEQYSNNYVYFTNLLDETKYIERVANVHESKWCRPYQNEELNLPEKNEMPELKLYPFENVQESKRDESLDCVCGITNSPKLGARIVGGDEAVPYSYGWVVQIWNKFNIEKWNFCGGSIINDLMILTAAHCVFDNSTGGFSTMTKVIARTHDLVNDPLEMYLPVKEVAVHPAFIFGSTHDINIFDSDIAVVILSERIKFASGTHDGNTTKTDIRPICLPKIGHNIKVTGKEALTVGWGLTGHLTDPNNRPPQAEKLKELHVPIKNITECVKSAGGAVSDRVLCYTSYNYTGTAQGDSGSPLMIKDKHNGLWTVIGATSWGVSGFDYDVYIEEAENPTGSDPVFQPQINAYTDVQKLLNFVDYYAQENDAKWCRSRT